MVNKNLLFILILSMSFLIILCSGKSNVVKNDNKISILHFHSGFHEGLAAFSLDGKMGFIDKTGKFVIKPIYDNTLVFKFSEGLVNIKLDDEWFYIDKNGNKVFDDTFDLAYPFSEGLALVRKGNTYYYIDKTGNYINLPPYSNKQDSFESENLAKRRFSGGLAMIKVDGKYGYMNKKGEIVIRPEYDYAEPFSESYALVSINREGIYINKSGEIVIQPEYDRCHLFSEGLAFVEKSNIDIKDGKYLFKFEVSDVNIIDRTGDIVLDDKKYIHIYKYSEGLAPFSSYESHKMGYLDKNGNIAIQEEYLYGRLFSEGLALVTGYIDGESKQVFIDKNGDVVIDELIW